MQKYYVEVTDSADAGAYAATHWYKDPKIGIRHRLDGPALEYADGDKVWFVDGEIHRVDGPAVEKANGDKEWFWKSIKVSKKEHARRTAPVQEMTVAQIEAALSYKVKVVK